MTVASPNDHDTTAGRNDARHEALTAARQALVDARAAAPDTRRRAVDQAATLLRQARALTASASAGPIQGLAKTAGAHFAPSAPPSVRLSDVAGNDAAKRALHARLVYPLRHPEVAAHYGRRPGGGVLLYGPPGTGKTLLARAAAGEAGVPVFAIKSGDIVNKWVGESEQRLAALFATARTHPVAILFIDEVDALAPARGRDASGVMDRLVPQLLAELDGFERPQNRLLFLAATNRPWAIDPALMRPGRFDELCYVGLPERDARERILAGHLAGAPLCDDVDIGTLVDATEGYTGADLGGLAERAVERAYLRAVESGENGPVERADFTAVRGQSPRSVTEAMLARYVAFAQERGNPKGGLEP